MAPPSGPRGGTASRRRDGNRSSGSTLTGGISKRRGNVPIDRDGDVSMDAPAGGSNPGRGGRGTRASKGSRGTARAARVSSYVEDNRPTRFNRQVLKIHGLKNTKAASNPDGGLRGLIEFIERKASKDKPVKIGRRALDGDCVWINVGKEDAPAVLHLNGYSYAGGVLTVTETDERVPMAGAPANSAETAKHSKDAAELKQKLGEVLARRYNPEGRLLDLSSLGSDPVLSTLGTFESESRAMKAFRALLHIVSETYKNPREKEEGIQAVTVANNQVDDVNTIYQLALDLPGLKRLDLSNNKLDSISKLAKWKGQFRHLEELHLAGNGVVNQENYVTELLGWFPFLQILNGQQVRTRQQIDEYLKTRSATPFPTFLPSNVRDSENVTEAFVRAFFPLYDTDRATLVSTMYDKDSVFSLSTPPAPRPTPAWSSYVKYSRNLDPKALRTSHRSTVTKRLYTGANAIADVWKTLPATQHPLPESGRWIVDSHLLPNVPEPSVPGHPGVNGMIITLNCEFEEADVSQNLFGTRGFSRTIILGPVKPTPPPNTTPPYRVLSDQLTLHSWKPQQAVVEQPPAPVMAPAPVIAPAPPVAAEPTVDADGIDPQVKAHLTAELAARTGMTMEYAQLCLSGAPNWNFDAAVAAFHQMKAALPPSAFTPRPSA
ncbi:hypothetical protein QBC37DRAFT_107260 [Rhypophila decipiens]|uniref:mRNA export factor MEX67 n=1 Tax=Rhypophila decipiens TaxID=261697 RepID=A0AAN6XYM3_9PEZI|nr:hypothetical protein QBC37DRAFT_107260 [Rhypophila decipiens]